MQFAQIMNLPWIFPAQRVSTFFPGVRTVCKKTLSNITMRGFVVVIFVSLFCNLGCYILRALSLANCALRWDRENSNRNWSGHQVNCWGACGFPSCECLTYSDGQHLVDKETAACNLKCSQCSNFCATSGNTHFMVNENKLIVLK